MIRSATCRALAEKAVATRGVSIALACRAFKVSKICYRYSPKLDDGSEHIADLLPIEQVVRALNHLVEWRGASKTIRVGNGPEYISGTLMEWAENKGIALAHIQPRKPQQTPTSSATTGRSGTNS